MSETDLKLRIIHLESVLIELIIWMASSANSPITPNQAGQLIDKIGEQK